MLAFSNDYYGFIFRVTQSVELFCTYFFFINKFLLNLIMEYYLFIYNTIKSKRLIFRYDRKIPDYFSVVGAP